ncbi:hypothetical protein [Nocardiopsis ansamitocini]|uniref:Transmembrane protein n=1 Tax=Nocardiopsis ansamitocini TaxID=1670832 RepID=A0A9W6P6I5_9ACTN|nr:hypothetical protein [Nocardiopsis ansamitocini]GLU47982.1 hypothetical protein Nans01_23330 [Nocardiopsis ansamitocini]
MSDRASDAPTDDPARPSAPRARFAPTGGWRLRAFLAVLIALPAALLAPPLLWMARTVLVTGGPLPSGPLLPAALAIWSLLLCVPIGCGVLFAVITRTVHPRWLYAVCALVLLGGAVLLAVGEWTTVIRFLR